MEVEEFPEGSQEMVVIPAVVMAVLTMSLVSRSRIFGELTDGCDDGCGYRAGYWLLM